ncbi:MAG: hypothetical protein HQK81_04575 [Desulfovibrionaceae bacterium]|nr:hypothetical protein [Desulfovibrionaceae bacterium]MBF0513320.1 hypothetical protein [Desulfovibrionaceae bacterium]
MTGIMQRVFLVLALVFALGLASCGGDGAGFDESGRYLNNTYGFSFIPPKGWIWHEGKTGECQYVAGAYRGDDLYVYVCVNDPPPEALDSGSDEENCAHLAKYIQNKFQGRHVECRPTHIQRAKALSAMFYREVDGHARGVQIVSTTAIVHEGRILMMNATATGTGPESAKSAFGRSLDDLTTAAGSFWLH